MMLTVKGAGQGVESEKEEGSGAGYRRLATRQSSGTLRLNPFGPYGTLRR